MCQPFCDERRRRRHDAGHAPSRGAEVARDFVYISIAMQDCSLRFAAGIIETRGSRVLRRCIGVRERVRTGSEPAEPRAAAAMGASLATWMQSRNELFKVSSADVC